MSYFESKIALSALATAFLLITGVVTAQQDELTDTEAPGLEQSEGPALPEAVAALVDAMSGVQRVEPLEDGLFAVHRRMSVTGSRIQRDITMQVAKDGSVVNWGRTPMFSRSYTRRQLIQTGEIDAAEALEKLDPAIQSNGGR